MSVLNSNLLIVGVDEAGRGPLAGPVFAAAVILDVSIVGIKDSKLLSEKKRFELAEIIKSKALDYAISYATPQEIDEFNIHNASLLAMERAIKKLSYSNIGTILIDGMFTPPGVNLPMKAIVKGDRDIPVIAAASILAKTSRDVSMIEEDKKYPEYGFATHKGYPTKMHIEALHAYGITPIHRKTFGPVKILLQGLIR